MKGCLDICHALGQRKNNNRGREGGSFGWFSDFFFWSSCLFAPLFLSCLCVCVCVCVRERERERERESERENFFCDYIFECFEYSLDSYWFWRWVVRPSFVSVLFS